MQAKASNKRWLTSDGVATSRHRARPVKNYSAGARMSTRNAATPQFLNDPETIEAPQPETIEASASQDTGHGDYRVVLYNDDFHGMDEVALQLQKATGCDLETAISIMLEAHMQGRAVCYRGAREECHRVARILREIRLQVEVDCD